MVSGWPSRRVESDGHKLASSGRVFGAEYYISVSSVFPLVSLSVSIFPLINFQIAVKALRKFSHGHSGAVTVIARLSVGRVQ